MSYNDHLASGPAAAVSDGEYHAPAAVPGSAGGSRRLLMLALLAAASCALLVCASVWFVDRPFSTWIHDHLGDARFAFFTMTRDTHPLPIGPFSLMAGPAEATGPLSIFALAGLAAAAVVGWRPKARGRIILVLSLSIPVTMEIVKELKWVFGRTWPESWLGDNPSWIRDGMFGFFPLHGGSGWGSFPSGHTAVITTAATILWIVLPELRFLWVTVVAFVISGLIGANYHFVSDVIGGLYLGVAIGLGLVWLMLPPDPRHGIPARWTPNASSRTGGSQRAPNETCAGRKMG